MGINERKNREKQALRERILEAAQRIVIREGFAALSMRKIADAIEYSPATLYLYFASRDEIARALCAQGYAQLLAGFEPLAQIADPAERLRALARAYVAFGVAHPQTYRLIFMEDPTYLGAALGGTGAASKASGKARNSESNGQPNDHSGAEADDSGGHSRHATLINPAASDDSSDASIRLMVGALEELKAAGRLPASADSGVWVEALWATMHGIVSLNLTCPVFPTAPLDTVLDAALDAWFGAHAQTGTAAAAQTEPAPSTTTTATAAKPARRARRPAAKPNAVDA
ncbi:TetR/AcrR family transcriptional regulator [Paraburkholderia sp. BCC1885]|uniref:TetR/AcrR family transcriptional regulator n=1 Tax=Paraburkholderia sp. BCC1885 TaxID=2562669 RepID=UPI00118366BA|nr:TetR/AcrR family transcriptional regulator [Paraburkholderia sp. BCC1885]